MHVQYACTIMKNFVSKPSSSLKCSVTRNLLFSLLLMLFYFTLNDNYIIALRVLMAHSAISLSTGLNIYKEYASFPGFGQLMGVACKRKRAGFSRFRKTKKQHHIMQEVLTSKYNKLLSFSHEEFII